MSKMIHIRIRRLGTSRRTRPGTAELDVFFDTLSGQHLHRVRIRGREVLD